MSESDEVRRSLKGAVNDTADLWFDILLSHSPDNLFIIQVKDESFYLHWANKTLERAAGASLADMHGKSIREILGDDAGVKLEASYRRCLTSRHPIEYEETALDGESNIRYWHTLLVPKITSSGDVPFIYGVSRDVTEIVQAKKDIERANQVKVGFLGHMSHEVKTPLQSITGALSLLREAGLNEVQQKYIDIIDVSRQSILRMATDILDYAKLEAGKLQFQYSPFSLTELVGEIYSMMALLAEEKQLLLHLRVLSASGVALLGDSGRVKQVLCNLLSNAIKFTPSGEVSLEVNAVDDGDQVQVTFKVRDEGVGIPAEDIGKLFQPFSRLENATEHKVDGTGLGLAISKELVERMGGSIGVTSVPGEGAEFTVTLPFTADTEDEADDEVGRLDVPGRVAPLSSARVGGGRLLVAEDNSMCQIIVRELLVQAGFDVVVVSDGRQALEEFKHNQYDLILLDWIMPGMDGKKAARHMRAWEATTGGHVPIIGMTGGSSAEEYQQLREAGMDAVINKPVAASEMIEVIHRWLYKN